MLGYVGLDIDDADRSVTDGWLRTGDVGRFDSDGCLYMTGHVKVIIIHGGENLSPQVIGNVINTHTEIAACCVVGRPDNDLGEVPVAFVVCRAGSHVTADDIKALIRNKLPRSCRLNAIFLLVVRRRIPLGGSIASHSANKQRFYRNCRTFTERWLARISLRVRVTGVGS